MTGPAALRDFDPAYDRNGVKPGLRLLALMSASASTDEPLRRLLPAVCHLADTDPLDGMSAIGESGRRIPPASRGANAVRC